MLRRILALVALLSLTLPLVACGDDKKELQKTNAYSTHEVLGLLLKPDPCDIDQGALRDAWNTLDEDHQTQLLSEFGVSDYRGLVAEFDDRCEKTRESSRSSVAAEESHAARLSEIERERQERLAEQERERSLRTSQTAAPRQTPGPPAGRLDPSKEWRLMGPFSSLWTCEQNSGLQPIQVSECFMLDDGAYYWNVVQSGR